jgi:hypothetical protein
VQQYPAGRDQFAVIGQVLAGCAATKLSSRGQVVVPEVVRNDLGLLKVSTPPKLVEFQELLCQARLEAKKAGIKKAQLKSAIAGVSLDVSSLSQTDELSGKIDLDTQYCGQYHF